MVEACLQRPWLGNVRELLIELRDALARAHDEGAEQLRPQHLAAGAGLALVVAAAAPRDALAASGPSAVAAPVDDDALSASAGVDDASSELDDARTRARARMVEVLEASGHNISAVAWALGIHRTQVYREIQRLGVPLRRRIQARRD